MMMPRWFVFLKKEKPHGTQSFKVSSRSGGQFKDQVSFEVCVYVVGSTLRSLSRGKVSCHLQRVTLYCKAWAAGYGVEIKVPQMGRELLACTLSWFPSVCGWALGSLWSP